MATTTSMKLDVEKFSRKNDFDLWKIKMSVLLIQHGLVDEHKPPMEWETICNQGQEEQNSREGTLCHHYMGGG